MSTTQRAARRTFVVLAVIVTLLGAYHMVQATLGLAASPAHAWQHLVIGVLYMLSAMGLVIRPRGFVLFLAGVTVYTVIAAVVNVFRSAAGDAAFSLELALGFFVFPVALNLLAADAIHEESLHAFGT